MSRCCLIGLTILLIGGPGLALADDPVFSGPQIGEKLPSFKAKGVFAGQADKELDLVKQADGKPLALIFVHAKTRPAFGLTNKVMQYAATRSKNGLVSGVVFLTDDATAMTRWMRNVKQYLPEGVTHVVYADGAEGPGSYGLNRNVTLTVLIAKEGKVTANFALVQPSLEADGPKILKAIVDVTGGGKVPTITELGGGRYERQAQNTRKPAATRPNAGRGQNDPELTSLLRSVINKQATEEQVRKAAAKVEEYVADKENARRQLGRISNTVVSSGKLFNYGTEAAQEVLRKWAKKYPKPRQAPKPDRPQNKDKKRGNNNTDNSAVGR
jgi:hypothetical protein